MKTSSLTIRGGVDLIWNGRWRPTPSSVVSKSSKLSRNWKGKLTALLAWNCSPGWSEPLTSQKCKGEILEMREPQKSYIISPCIPGWPGNYAYVYARESHESLEESTSQAALKTDGTLNEFLNPHTHPSAEDGSYKLMVFEHNLCLIIGWPLNYADTGTTLRQPG